MLVLNSVHSEQSAANASYTINYPQIIQDGDYATIEFIESFYSVLNKSKSDEFFCRSTALALSCGDEKTSNIIFQIDKNVIKITGHKTFSDTKTITLARKLFDTINSLKKNDDPIECKFSSFATIAYRKRTVIEFDLGAKIVVVDSFSNGPKDPERLYILDSIDREQSLFFFQK